MSKDLYDAMVRAPMVAQPLIFAFHGTGGNEAQLFEMISQRVTGAGVVSPRGDIEDRGGARFFRRMEEGDHDLDDLARATHKMVAFVEAHLADVRGHPVYAFGYSNGANLLASVLMARPDLFQRVALLHPTANWNFDTSANLSGRKVLVTGGQRDFIAPVAGIEPLTTWLADAGADVATEFHDGGHELRNTEWTAIGSLFGANGPS